MLTASEVKQLIRENGITDYQFYFMFGKSKTHPLYYFEQDCEAVEIEGEFYGKPFTIASRISCNNS